MILRWLRNRTSGFAVRLSGQVIELTVVEGVRSGRRHNYARLGMPNAISVLVGRSWTSRFATVDHSCGHALAEETMHREDQFIPELIVHNGPAALDFYKSVFGAEEVHRMLKPGSEKLMHGELTLEGHKFFVCDEFPASEGGTCQSPETLRGTGVRITLL